jgi:ATP-dependent DNA ligase
MFSPPARCRSMTHLIDPTQLSPMEAKLAAALPTDAGWQFEPKWDGFRCLAFRHGAEVELMSKSGKSLARFFPEVVALVAGMSADRFVLDGELIIPIGDVLSFAALQARLHPAESRIAKLSLETPAQLMLFDCLQFDGTAMIDRPLVERRVVLKRLVRDEHNPAILLSPASTDPDRAASWLGQSGGALDGVVAKRLDMAYRPGERAMVKVKQHRTADCVVGGFRYETGGDQVGSLLLGLYNGDGQLDHVGFTSAISNAERSELTARLEAASGSMARLPAARAGGARAGPPTGWHCDRSSSSK